MSEPNLFTSQEREEIKRLLGDLYDPNYISVLFLAGRREDWPMIAKQIKAEKSIEIVVPEIEVWEPPPRKSLIKSITFAILAGIILFVIALELFSVFNPNLVYVLDKKEFPGMIGTFNGGRGYIKIYGRREIRVVNGLGLKEILATEEVWNKAEEDHFIELPHPLNWYQ
jgi:hypothetical protein